MLCYVPFNECPSFIFCDFIFDGKMALQQIVMWLKRLQQRGSLWKYRTCESSCPCALVHAELRPGAPHLVQGWFRELVLQTSLGLSWAALPLVASGIVLRLSGSPPASMV